MLLSLIELSVLLQPAATSGGGAPAAPTGGGAAGPLGGCNAGGVNMAMIALMFAVFYFLLIRPQQKRQKAQEAMLSALAKGVVVRTTGGIRGEITQIDEREVTLLVADRTRINVLRSAIAGPEAAASVQDEKNEKNEKK